MKDNLFKFEQYKKILNYEFSRKRDFIHSHLHEVDERLINEFYENLRKEEVLKAKLVRRAQQSENDIKENKFYSRSEIEQRTNKAIRE